MSHLIHSPLQHKKHQKKGKNTKQEKVMLIITLQINDILLI